MRRALTWLGWIVAVLVALPIVAVIAVLVLANTGSGRALIESQTAKLTGGMVRLQGIAGRFPDRLRIGTIEVADAKGVYVTIHDAALDWSPLRLVRMTVAIDQLTARAIDLPRLPESTSESSSKSTSSSSSYSLPVRIELGRLHVDTAAIGAPVAGVAATLSLDGEGRADSLTDASVRLVAKRLDSPGEYRVTAALAGPVIKADVRAEEPPHGLISGIARLPDLGAVSIQASVDGPRDALATQAGVKAGDLTASAAGTVDLDHESADLRVQAQAPAMTPAPGVSWQSVLVDARVHGPFTSPDAAGTVRLRDLAAGGAKISALDADVSGNAGQVKLTASATVPDIPGPKPDLLAAAPVRLEATAELDKPDRPVRFTVTHPLLALDGTAQTAGVQKAQVHLVVSDLAPLAAVGAVDLRGSADLNAQAEVKGDTTTLALQGKLGVTGGLAPVPPLIGPAATIDMAAALQGQTVTLSHLTVNGKTLRVTAKGSLADQVLDADWTLALTDLAAVQPGVSGKVEAKGHAGGKLTDLTATADIVSDVAARGYASGRVTTRIEASGLPDAPKASVTAQGTLLEAPLSLAVTGDRVADGTVHATIERVTWKSLKAGGALTVPPGAMLPLGTLRLTMTRLADLSPLVGQPVNGDATVTLDSTEQAAKANVTIRGLGVAGAANAGRLVLAGTVTDPLKNPTIDATMTADGVSATSVSGTTAKVTVKGTLDALAVAVTANATAAGAPTRLSTTATVNADAQTVLLRTLEATWKQQTIRLLGPANIAFKDGVSVDRLRLGFRQAVLTLAGKAGNTLDLTATLRDLPADIGAIVDPTYAADGVINAEARLTGTPARPEGTVKLTADRVRQRRGPGQALPPANLNLNATLQGTSVRLDARLAAGASTLTATGTAPMAASGPLNLRTEGRVDLTMLDPILMAEGRRLRGILALNATIGGTAVEPRANGTVTLSGGAFTDYRQNVRVTNIEATVQANGDTITLSRFSGRAGEGTLGGSGTIGLAGAMPVDLRFTASNARPIAGDLLTAVLNADLTVRGDVKGRLEAGGTVTIMRADIRIPETLPASIAVLPVRNPNAPPPPPPAPPSDSIIALNIAVNAPEQVFIRGRGLNAELGGSIHIGGTTTNPQPSGALTLRRGTLSIIGTTLNFTEGQIDYNGGDLTNPALRFVAQSVTSTLVATLTITGDVQHLKIALSSVPDMPQDEILAQMLFNTDSSKLSPLQLAQIAAALAQLSGATSGIGDPLDKLRSSLGLDRLTVGSDSSGKPTLEAGRYISRRVYVGARQSASGGGSQATLQVDLTKGLKLEATAGSGQTTATGSTSSSDAATVGLRYQFEY